jgi:Flp pilus assembly protein CpaB
MGEGAINGRGRYGFLLSVVDGQRGGRLRSDMIRIKIWDRDAANRVVYDSQMGAADDAAPTIVIGGGSIVTHEK